MEVHVLEEASIQIMVSRKMANYMTCHSNMGDCEAEDRDPVCLIIATEHLEGVHPPSPIPQPRPSGDQEARTYDAAGKITKQQIEILTGKIGNLESGAITSPARTHTQ